MQVLCGQCGHTTDVDDLRAGGNIACPQCGRIITIPDASGERKVTFGAADDLLGAQEEEGFAAVAKAAMDKKVRVVCGKCGRGLLAGTRMMGKTQRCPACGANILIPRPEDQAEAALADLKILPQDQDQRLDLSQDTEDFSAQLRELNAQLGIHQESQPAVPQAWRESPQAAASAADLAAESAAAMQSLQQASAPAAVVLPAQASPTTPSAAGGVQHAQQAPAMRPGVAPDYVPVAAPVQAAAPVSDLRRRLPLILFATLVGFFAAIVVSWAVLTKQTTTPPGPPVADNRGQPAVTGTVDQMVAGVISSTQDDVKPPHDGENGDVKPPVPNNTFVLKITDAQADVFGAGQYYAARPDHLWWRVTVAVDPMIGSADLKAQGDDIELEIGTQKYPCLGCPGDSSPLPALAVQKNIAIRQGQAQRLVLLFDLPVGAVAGTLHIKSVGSIDVRPASAGVKNPDMGQLAGIWAEQQPRNLQPMLRDPVMAALQNATPGAMSIAVKTEKVQPKDPDAEVETRKIGLEVSIPGAGLAALFKPAGPGIYLGQFERGQSKLDCKLRVGTTGQIVLYLSDEPFHQVMYRKPPTP